MAHRPHLSYHVRWVRLLCCCAVGLGVGTLVGSAFLSSLEASLQHFLVPGDPDPTWFTDISLGMERRIAFGLCLALAIPRFERPISMILCGLVFVLLYAGAYLYALISVRLVLPVISPAIGLVAASAVLETMAWNGERSRRRGLERLEASRQRLADMLVHDLRKRVSSALMSLHILERSEGTDRLSEREHRRTLSALRASLERTTLMIGNLLDIRKTQEQGLALTREPLQTTEILEQCRQEIGSAVELAGLTLAIESEAHATVIADREVVARILANLVWNALQHAPRGSTIRLASRTSDAGGTLFSVGNRGPTIPPEWQEQVMRPFISGAGNDEGPRPGSAGLGLAFCKLAAEAHGAALELESPWQEAGEGVLVRVIFPGLSEKSSGLSRARRAAPVSR